MFDVIVGSDFPKKIIPLIDNAKKNIDIVVYDWRWYQDQNTHPVQQFNCALVRAVQRSVFVRAILNSADIIPILIKVGIKAKKLKDHRTVHSKLLIIDNSIVVIGSHNFTRNAFGANVETSLVANIPTDHHRLMDLYNNLYNL